MGHVAAHRAVPAGQRVPGEQQPPSGPLGVDTAAVVWHAGLVGVLLGAWVHVTSRTSSRATPCTWPSMTLTQA